MNLIMIKSILGEKVRVHAGEKCTSDQIDS
jgi:hypothetical protein